MDHRNRLTLNEFENKLRPFPLGIADYRAGPAMDANSECSSLSTGLEAIRTGVRDLAG
jgi:hypothetical protein